MAWNVKGKPLYLMRLRLRDGLEQQWRDAGKGSHIIQTKQPLLNLQRDFLYSVSANSEKGLWNKVVQIILPDNHTDDEFLRLAYDHTQWQLSLYSWYL